MRLLRGTLRGDTGRLLGLLLSAVLAVPVAAGLTLMLTFAAFQPATSRDVAVVVFSSAVLAWLFVPVLGFGLDETLDPARFAVFPLRAGQLLTGLFAASAIGLGPMMTVLVVLGAALGAASGPVGTVVAVAAAVLVVALCLALARLVVTVLSGLLRQQAGC